jgi:hypothetical protein
MHFYWMRAPEMLIVNATEGLKITKPDLQAWIGLPYASGVSDRCPGYDHRLLQPDSLVLTPSQNRTFGSDGPRGQTIQSPALGLMQSRNDRRGLPSVRSTNHRYPSGARGNLALPRPTPNENPPSSSDYLLWCPASPAPSRRSDLHELPRPVLAAIALIIVIIYALELGTSSSVSPNPER